jgi:lactate permease
MASIRHHQTRIIFFSQKASVIASFVVSSLAFAAPQWRQIYNPTGHLWMSSLLAALPLLVLLVAIMVLRWKAHVAALLASGVCILIAIGLFHMPAGLGLLAAVFGAAYGIFPIFWIIFPVIFLYQLTVKAGSFSLLQGCLTGVTQDSRLQLLVVAFALGGFFEGAAGFGTPVAVCGTLLIGFGFSPLQAAAFALMANTAPVAFGGLGIPVVALAGVTNFDLHSLTAMIATILAPFCVLVPFWLILAFVGFAGMLEVWPAIAVAGVTFGVVQLLVARLHGPWLVDIFASAVTIGALLVLFRFWQPARVLDAGGNDITGKLPDRVSPERSAILRAILPWGILTLGLILWGAPPFGHFLDSFSTFKIHVPGLDNAILRVPPAVVQPAAEPAVFTFNMLSATGTGIFISALVAAFAMGLPLSVTLKTLREVAYSVRFTFITIAALMSIGFVSRFCGLDATLGLAFAATGAFYPLFGTFIGWIGTASTGSDTSSNVIFGSLQKLAALQLGLSPLLMASANSAGGVMAKMISPQNVVVATTATGSYGKEGTVIRFVLVPSLVLAALVGLVVTLLARYPAFANFVLR